MQQMNNLKLYGMIVNLKNRLELADERGQYYSPKQIALAIEKVNELNAVLDRRAGKDK